MNELIVNAASTLSVEPLTASDFEREFLAGRKDTTLAAYRQSLQDFAHALGARDINDAMRMLLGGGRGTATAIVLRYKANLIERALAANTINVRLAAIRAAAKFARDVGLIDWTISVRNVKATRYRDTRGPGEQAVRALIGTLERGQCPKAVRDLAIVRLLHDLGLRRKEVVGLDLGDVDLAAGTIAIVGKGETDRQILTLPRPTSGALVRWIARRGPESGPLFINFDRAGKGQRLTGRSVTRIVRKLGEQLGIGARPHGIRHTAITKALDKTGGDYRKVQRFSRHADIRTVMVYDDNREDLAGEVARLVAGQ